MYFYFILFENFLFVKIFHWSSMRFLWKFLNVSNETLIFYSSSFKILNSKSWRDMYSFNRLCLLRIVFDHSWNSSILFWKQIYIQFNSWCRSRRILLRGLKEMTYYSFRRVFQRSSLVLIYCPQSIFWWKLFSALLISSFEYIIGKVHLKWLFTVLHYDDNYMTYSS